MKAFNFQGVRAIYMFELARFRRTLWQSLATPVITTALYFVVLARRSVHASAPWMGWGTRLLSFLA
jgi:hypothetical protein